VRTSFIVLAVLVGSMIALTTPNATAGSGGSSYSLLGIGDLRYPSGIRSAGMGYTGLGIFAPNYINSVSPATWAHINRTRLEAGLLYEGFNSTDAATSRYLARVDFNGAILAIPISQPNGIVFGAGIVPYSNINYDTYTPGVSGIADTVAYSIHHRGTGGVTRAFTGFSYAPLPELAFGFSMNYMFGSLDNVRELIPKTPGYAGGIETQTSSISGLTFTLGGLYNGFGSLAEALRPLSLGFFISSRGNLRSNIQTLFLTAPALSVEERDTLNDAATNVVLPVNWGVGISYQLGERYLFAADYVSQNWANTEISGITPQNIRNSSMIGIGVERISSKETNDSWGARIALRLGGYYNATYYLVNGVGINEYGITGGMTLPLFSNSLLGEETRLSVALSYSIRGNASNGQIQDKIWRCTVAINIAQLWFVRHEED
jgi:hypothetical protein